MRFQLDQFLFDVGTRTSERFGVAAVFVFDFEDVVVAGELDDVADFARLETERGFFERFGQRFAFDPAPVPAFLPGAVLGIKLRHAFELGAVDELAENFVGHRFLRCRVPVTGVARDHYQAQFDLRLAGELVPVRLVIFVHLRGRSDDIEFDVLAPHRLDDNFFRLHLFEFAHGVILRLERFDEGIAIAPKICPDDVVHSLFDIVIRDLKVLLLKCLNNKLPIDQILERRLAGFLHFFDQIVAAKLGAQ